MLYNLNLVNNYVRISRYNVIKKIYKSHLLNRIIP